MAQRKFRLWAHVSSDNQSAIKTVLEQIIVKREPSDKQIKDSKLRPILKEKAQSSQPYDSVLVAQSGETNGDSGRMDIG